MRILAIDVGGTFMKCAVISPQGMEPLPKRPTPSGSLAAFLDAVEEIYRSAENVEGIAMSMPGVLDETTGYMFTGGALDKIIHELDLPAKIKERCGKLPVSVANDGKCGARAEMACGALQGVKNAVMVVLGTGVAGAVIVDGEVMSGSHHFAGELSFLFTPLLDGESEIGVWGRRGGSARVSQHYQDLSRQADTMMPEEIFDLAQNGDETALAAIGKYCDEIAMAATTLQCITDPEVIAFGGGISQQPMLIPLVEQSIRTLHRRLGLRRFGMPEIRVVACQYHNNAMGAYLHFLKLYGEGKNHVE